jgi:glycosyltransferase involved in cell wall biosynthesis
MRILVLLTDGFGGSGGIAKFNRDLLNSLCSHPAVQKVVALPRLIPEPVGELPAKLEYISSAAGGKIRFAIAALKSSIVNRQSAVIFCAHINLLPVAFAMRQFCRAPVVLIIHGIDAWQPTRSRLANYLAKRIDAFVSASDFTRQRFLNWTKLNGTRSFILPNCIDQNRFNPGPKPMELLTRYGLRGRTVMMTLARLSAFERYKGIDEVLEVLPALAVAIPDLAYLICGDGDDGARLEQKAARLGVRNRVVFPGYIPEAEKVDHYRLADAFVMPGRGEGFGIVYLEAMACGIPVVASKADASREAVRNGEIGRLADPDKPEELKAEILQALSAGASPAERRPPSGLEYFSRPNFERRCHQMVEQVLTPACRQDSH